MKPKTFFLIALLVIIVTLVAVNWNQVKAALPPLPGGLLPGTAGTASNGNAGSTPASTTNNGSAAVKVANDYNKVLQKGVSGPEVIELQTLLNKANTITKHFVYNLAVDGKFGTLTDTMLEYYNGNRGSITLNQAYDRIKVLYGV